jgi:hypothetical protein
MQVDARTKLAAAQLKLVLALAGIRDAPDEFDRSRIEAARDVLHEKRARSVAHVWPRLARALGDSFDSVFASYARVAPIPRSGGALADGRAFVRELKRAGMLPEEGQLEAIAFDLHYAIRRNKTVTRSLAFRAAVFRESRRIVIAVRLPIIGERWLNIPTKIL